MIMLIHIIKDVSHKIYKDYVARLCVLGVIVFSIASFLKSIILGSLVLFSFINGCVITVFLLNNKSCVAKHLQKAKEILGYKDNFIDNSKSHCDTCSSEKCTRHNSNVLQKPGKDLLIDEKLDQAIDSFYTHILGNFITSWYTQISKDEDFIVDLKRNLRDATCRLIVKIKDVNAPLLITDKLLPSFFVHYEVISKMLLFDKVPLDKISQTFHTNEIPNHPAVFCRQAELNYLRGVSKCLMPRLVTMSNVNCRIFSHLIRELLTFWVLLPLTDSLADPNIINLLIITVTNPSGNKKDDDDIDMSIPSDVKVEILKKFIARKTVPKSLIMLQEKEANLLKDQNKLYSFMQFLKKEGAVDLLRFYLDVEALNNDLNDPRISVDPSKLSAMFQQSDKLLQTYQGMMRLENEVPMVESLNEAFDHVKRKLELQWMPKFYKTSEFFKLVYGGRAIREQNDNNKLAESSSVSSMTKLGSKLKGAIRGAVDGAPIEALEMPTVWDALTESPNSNSNLYVSVSQKLRKEKGQSLDAFMSTFMHSVEQSPEMGEDVIMMKEKAKVKPKIPGYSVVFGDLFEVKRAKNIQTPWFLALNVSGPSQCVIYILVKILHVPIIIARLALAFCCVSRRTVDIIICNIISKLLKSGLKESRLAIMINLLKDLIFYKNLPEPTPDELLKRQQLARQRLENLKSGLGNVFDVLQSPILNKHLIYILLDIVLAELYPEFEE